MRGSASRRMELELGQLDLRYEALRTRSVHRERRVLASIAQVGQQMPIVVVREAQVPIVVDGYKRIRALRRLRHDTVVATAWELSEVDALVLERLLRSGSTDSAIEQGWLLREMSERFGLGREELARRFDRTPSWVSRRLALVGELAASVQSHVRSGAIGAHAAMKYLVPLARANESDCVKLAEAIAPSRPSSRQMAELYATYVSGNAETRALCVRDPLVVLRARAEEAREGARGKTPVEHLLDDLRIVGAVASRAHGRLVRGAIDGASEDERARVRRSCGEAYAGVGDLQRRCEKELCDAR
jgi:ParB family transcriptional regulator, chromosome partitioning protein